MTRKAYLPMRNEPAESKDYYPTPPDATRAFLHTWTETQGFDLISPDRVVWEPACGEGHMAEVIREYNPHFLIASDIHDRGYGQVHNFMDDSEGSLTREAEGKGCNVIMTNPPFNMAEEFVVRALRVSMQYVAMLVRVQFLEGRGRYERLWGHHSCSDLYRPTHCFSYVSRVHMVKNRIATRGDGGGSLTLAWLVWDKLAFPRRDPAIKFYHIDNRPR